LRKKIKLISFVCILFVSLAILSACQPSGTVQNNTGTNQTESTKDDDTSSEVTLRFAWWGGEQRHSATLDAINAYVAKNPHVKIEGEYMGYDGYYQKMVTQISGGIAPDIMQIAYEWFHDVAKRGEVFLDIGNQGIIDTSGFNKSLLDSYSTHNGKLLGLPTGISNITLIYNKDFFQEQGIPEDTEWTWEKILTTGKEINQKNPEKYLFYEVPRGWLEFVLKYYVEQHTGEQWVKDDYTMGFDREALIDGLQYIKDLVDNGVIQSFEETAALSSGNAPNPKWLSNDIGMQIQWTSAFSLATNNDSVNCDVAGYPIAENAVDKAIYVLPAQILTISNATKYPEETAKFVDWFFNSEEAQMILLDVRGIPAVESARNLLIAEGKIDSRIVKATNIALEDNEDSQSQLSTNPELNEIGENIVDEVGYKIITPEEGADKLIKLYAEKLEELKASAD